MSLLRQLWLVVLASALLAFVGGFAVNLVSAKHYLEQQMLAAGADTATSLALTMTQQSKDQATIELLVESQFDSGHFRVIRVSDVHGKTVIERHSDNITDTVPTWFVRLLPLKAAPGAGLVSNGWSQWGTVTVVAHDQFAYQALWDGAINFLLVMTLTSAVSVIAVTWLIRWVRRPLGELVRQAEAIGNRSFIKIDEPEIKELRLVVRTMNLMVDRVKSIFNEQAKHIEELRSAANRDSLTSLPNREFFMGSLRATLSDEGAALQGAVYLIRLVDLQGRNRMLGRAQADKYIRRIADAIADTLPAGEDYLLARLNGADFAVLARGETGPGVAKLAESMLSAVTAAAADFTVDSNVAQMGVAFYLSGESSEGAILLAADQALTRAESQGQNQYALGDASSKQEVSINDWRKLFDQAIDTFAFETAVFPVLRINRERLHDEMLLRLRADSGEVLTAGQFMPMASRLGYLAKLDLVTVTLACRRLREQPQDVAVNIAAASIDSPTFLSQLSTVLQSYQDVTPRLWLEVNEHGVVGNYDALAMFVALAHRHGCRVGIEHFGRQFGRIPALYDLHLDYLKIDGSFVRDIDQQSGNQELVKAIASVGASTDLMILAEAVHSEAEWSTLQLLGVHGATGPYATQISAH